MKMGKTNFSNLQKELLNMFHYQLPEAELLEIKKLLVTYFAKKVSDGADQCWEEKGWNNETMEKWVNEHLRPQP